MEAVDARKTCPPAQFLRRGDEPSGRVDRVIVVTVTGSIVAHLREDAEGSSGGFVQRFGVATRCFGQPVEDPWARGS